MSCFDGDILISNPLRWENMRRKLKVELKRLEEWNKPLILELGSGVGIHASIIENYGYKVLKTDNDPKVHPDRLVNIENPLPFLTNSFDMVIAHHVLEHIPYTSLDGVIREIGRILKPKGIFSFSLPHRRYWFRLGLRIPRLIDKEMNLYIERGTTKKIRDSISVHQWELDKEHTIKKIKVKLVKAKFSHVNVIHNDLEGFVIAKR